MFSVIVSVRHKEPSVEASHKFSIVVRLNISSRDGFVKSLAAAERRHIISACTTENDDSRGGSAEDGSSRASSRCLWIFWFGDEPILKDVLSDDLRGESSNHALFLKEPHLKKHLIFSLIYSNISNVLFSPVLPWALLILYY